jgi:hypothetical protein
MVMFLHLITDEKFIDGAISRFSKIDPDNHLFVYLLSSDRPVVFKHLKETCQIKFIAVCSPEYDNLLKNLSEYTAVFVHSLIPQYFVEFVNKAERDAVIVWLFWGAGLWSLKKFRTKSYLPFTKILYYKHLMGKHFKNLSIVFIKYFRMLLGTGFKNTIKTSYGKDTIKAMCRVNYVIPVVDDDYLVLKKHLHCQAEVLDWNYSPGLSFEELDKLPSPGNHILIGNSGHYTNNHLDIFFRIRRHRRCFEEIVVPLNYGDPVYTGSVIRAGGFLLRDQFHPLLDFLPVQEYFGLVSKCRVAVFNSRRQQALGNIIVCLFLGMKVFLRTENPIYQNFRKKGIAVFSIERELCRENLEGSLSERQRDLNKSVIREMFSEENLDTKTKQLICYLTEQKGEDFSR